MFSSAIHLAPACRLPQQLHKDIQAAWQKWNADSALHKKLQAFQRHPEDLSQWLYVWALSPWTMEQCLLNPEHFLELNTSGVLRKNSAKNDFMQRWGQEKIDSQSQLRRQLRRFRNREMIRLIWRDLNRLCSVQQLCLELSLLAEFCLETALQYHYSEACNRLGPPYSASGTTQEMVVFGMGKLGGKELNLSSDIDLIFAYPESGETRPKAGAIQLSNQEFFERLGKELIATLHTPTEDGFVFRVDMRLRPNGNSGPLALNFAALEAYYERQGRAWERYAMIKARPVAGDCTAGEELLTSLRPFVYRRYLDFSAIEELRQIKQNIATHQAAQDHNPDLKRGAGGIRRIEFIVQSLQLIFGGRNPALQSAAMLPALRYLATKNFLPQLHLRILRDAYFFLRKAEHALQAHADRQTQKLPEQPLQQMALATALGFRSWNAFCASLDAHRQRVEKYFQLLTRDPPQSPSQWQQLWNRSLTETQQKTLLQSSGFQDDSAILHALHSLQQSFAVRTLSVEGRRRLDDFMPLLLEGVSRQSQPELVFHRALNLVEKIIGRHIYLATLTENPGALQQLLAWLCHSSRIAEQLTAIPVLLDELLDREILYTPTHKKTLRDTLQGMPDSEQGISDIEEFMDNLRLFKHSNSLRVAVRDLNGMLTPDDVGHDLSRIAEIILQQTLHRCRLDMELRHGSPHKSPDDLRPADFIIVAYGRLGSAELNYDSDIDLIFLYDAEPQMRTTGKQPLDYALFFTHLAQRVINSLATRTRYGKAYAIDTRLRPSGSRGLLVSNFDAFAHYQKSQAWTWEHQALVRSRMVAGSPYLGLHFARLRKMVITQQRDSATLRRDVLQMYERIGRHRSAAGYTAELKQGSGGLMEIEMLAQYAVLHHAYSLPKLASWTDAGRILSYLAEKNKFPEKTAQRLAEIHAALKAELNCFSLRGSFDAELGTELRREAQLLCRQILC